MSEKVSLNGRRRAKRCRYRPRRVAGSLLLAGASGLTSLAVTESAQALPLITVSASGRVLSGTPVSDRDLNPYGIGLGLRGGVTLPLSLYLGASLDYFFGESDTLAGSTSLLQVMGHVGYDLGFGPLTLRPSLGLGLADSRTELGTLESSESDFVASPGAELLVGLGLFTVSAEARYNKIFADDSDGVILGVGLGFSL